VRLTYRRTRRDYAGCQRFLVQERYLDAACICIVQDNLNTHTAGALYATFLSAQAHRIISRLELQYTPTPGGWLNQAEIEFSVCERGCLSHPWLTR